MVSLPTRSLRGSQCTRPRGAFPPASGSAGRKADLSSWEYVPPLRPAVLLVFLFNQSVASSILPQPPREAGPGGGAGEGSSAQARCCHPAPTELDSGWRRVGTVCSSGLGLAASLAFRPTTQVTHGACDSPWVSEVFRDLSLCLRIKPEFHEFTVTRRPGLDLVDLLILI